MMIVEMLGTKIIKIATRPA